MFCVSALVWTYFDFSKLTFFWLVRFKNGRSDDDQRLRWTLDAEYVIPALSLGGRFQCLRRMRSDQLYIIQTRTLPASFADNENGRMRLQISIGQVVGWNTLLYNSLSRTLWRSK